MSPLDETLERLEPVLSALTPWMRAFVTVFVLVEHADEVVERIEEASALIEDLNAGLWSALKTVSAEPPAPV